MNSNRFTNELCNSSHDVEFQKVPISDTFWHLKNLGHSVLKVKAPKKSIFMQNNSNFTELTYDL